MPNDQPVSDDNFQVLLDWLDVDRESAGRKYEKIRRALIRIFAGRGCYDPELLADKTIDRVASKASSIAPTYDGEPALYFYGVAHKMHLEWLRTEHKFNKTGLAVNTAAAGESADENAEEFACLETCLAKLPAGSREMILEYYNGEKKEKIIHRQKLAESFGITPQALQTRVSRIRSRLHNCITLCLSKAR